MRYSLEPIYRKYVEGYGFLSFTRKFGDKYGATKTGTDSAKTASKGVVRKTADTTGELIGSKIADKITSTGRAKTKEEKDEANERQVIYIPPGKR